MTPKVNRRGKWRIQRGDIQPLGFRRDLPDLLSTLFYTFPDHTAVGYHQDKGEESKRVTFLLVQCRMDSEIKE